MPLYGRHLTWRVVSSIMCPSTAVLGQFCGNSGRVGESEQGSEMAKARNTRGKRRASRDEWMLVYAAAGLAGCSRETVMKNCLGHGEKGRDFQYVGGRLFVHRSTVIALRDRLAKERAAEGAA